MLRRNFASLAADLSYSDPIAMLLGDKAHCITSSYVHSPDAVLRAMSAVANTTMKPMASYQAQPQLRDQRRDRSIVLDEFASI
jgi:hypothetical protein